MTPKTVGSLCLCLHFNVSKYHDIFSPKRWFENMVSGTRPEKCIFQSYAIGADTYVIVSALPSSSIRHNGNSKRVFFWLPFPNHETTRLWKAKVKWHHKWQNHSLKPKKKITWSHRVSEGFESWVNVRESTKFLWGSNLHLRGFKHIVSFHVKNLLLKLSILVQKLRTTHTPPKV